MKTIEIPTLKVKSTVVNSPDDENTERRVGFNVGLLESLQ